jgi:hypothetical protein
MDGNVKAFIILSPGDACTAIADMICRGTSVQFLIAKVLLIY